jgi:hypothetical protein
MNRIVRVYDILEKYFPAESILNRIPNFNYKNHYVINDKFVGVISSTHNQNFRHNYTHIDEFTKEDILAMNIHDTFYKENNEHQIAKYFNGLLNNLVEYSNHNHHDHNHHDHKTQNLSKVNEDFHSHH